MYIIILNYCIGNMRDATVVPLYHSSMESGEASRTFRLNLLSQDEHRYYLLYRFRLGYLYEHFERDTLPSRMARFPTCTCRYRLNDELPLYNNNVRFAPYNNNIMNSILHKYHHAFMPTLKYGDFRVPICKKKCKS